MSSAERNPQDRPANAKTDIIMDFRSEYLGALADAQVQAEHTKTEGWRHLFSEHRKKLKDGRATLAKQIRMLAGVLDQFGWSEDEEKSVKDIVKESAQLRGTDMVFDSEVIARVQKPVTTCEKIARDYMSKAEGMERDAPLHNVGLAELMRLEVKKHPKPVWRPDDGMVEIVPPAA